MTNHQSPKELIVNHRWIAIAFATISALGEIALSQPTQAIPVSITESSDFDTINSIFRVVNRPETPLFILGNVKSIDTTDVIKFTPAAGITNVKMSFKAANPRTLFRIYEDSDNNGRVNVGDRNLITQRPSGATVSIPVAQGKTYLAQVFWFRDTLDSVYTLIIDGFNQ